MIEYSDWILIYKLNSSKWNWKWILRKNQKQFEIMFCSKEHCGITNLFLVKRQKLKLRITEINNSRLAPSDN